MAGRGRKKLKPPGARRGGQRKAPSNTGWWVLIGAVVLLGVAGVVASRDGGSGSSYVEELVAPDIGGAEEISVTSVAVEPYDRVAEGDDVFELSAGDEERTVTAPGDGFVVQIAAAEGSSVAPGTVLGTFQPGPDLSATNAAGHHWHTALGINICGQWLGQLGETTGDFHTHGDGLIHAHAQSSAAAGTSATLGLWFERVGGSVSSSRVEYGGETYESGDVDCDGEPGALRWALNGEERDDDPADLVVGNGDVVAIAFVPEDAELDTVPPSMLFMAENYAEPKHPDYEPPPPPEPPAEEAPAGEEPADGGTEPTGAPTDQEG